MKKGQLLFPIQLGVLFGLIVLLLLLPGLVNLGAAVSIFPNDGLFGMFYTAFPALFFLIIVIALFYIGAGRI